MIIISDKKKLLNELKKNGVLFYCCTICLTARHHDDDAQWNAKYFSAFTCSIQLVLCASFWRPKTHTMCVNWLRHHFSYMSEFASNVKSLYSSLFSLIAITSASARSRCPLFTCDHSVKMKFNFIHIWYQNTLKKPISITLCHIESSQQLTCNVWLHTFWCSKTWTK